MEGVVVALFPASLLVLRWVGRPLFFVCMFNEQHWKILIIFVLELVSSAMSNDQKASCSIEVFTILYSEEFFDCSFQSGSYIIE